MFYENVDFMTVIISLKIYKKATCKFLKVF